MVSTAVLILAAGRGTRMRSARPKVLHTVGGLSLLRHVLRAVRSAGVPDSDVAIVAGYGAGEVTAEAAPLRVLVQEPQLGTGHAVQSAAAWWSSYRQVVVLNGDMPLLSAATVRALIAGRGDAAAILASASPAEPRAYGRIVRSPAAPDQILAIVEDKQATPEQKAIRELNAGFYCFATPELRGVLGELGTANPHGEYYLTDAVAHLAARGHRVRGLALSDADECLGINDRAELAALDQRLRRRKAQQWLAAGVSIQLPDTVVLDVTAEAGPDSFIAAGAQLLGTTRIGSGCSIGAGSILINTTLADGVRVLPHCMLESAAVETEAVIGPFSRLRPGARIGAKAVIGNFVEVKNSSIGAGSKAQHLSYLGDATVGSGVNVGAGTITCNYDGKVKHPTHIGDGTFVGSHSTLVAPVEIGAGAFIAAGSVITDNVAADALGLGRARQEVKPGWAARRRNRKP